MKYYLNNSYAQMQACSGGQPTYEYPEKIYLDITQDCNLYCKMCRDRLEITGKVMPFQLFCKLVDETSPFVKSYSLFNWGEPLIVKDFFERVNYVNSAKRTDCSVDISTNGMLLKDEMIGFLRSNRVKVTVSFDGADKSTFERIRCGAKFELICDNVKRLSQAYSDVFLQEAPGIYISIQKDNQNQLLQIAQLTHSLGIKRIGFGIVTAPEEFSPNLNNDLRHEIECTMKYIDENKMLNDLYPTRVGEYLWWGNQYIHQDNFIVDNRCNAPLVSASIAYNGDVFLCCNYGDLAGNVTDKSFKEVWQSNKYNELRSSVNSIDLMPKKCKNCSWVNR